MFACQRFAFSRLKRNIIEYGQPAPLFQFWKRWLPSTLKYEVYFQIALNFITFAVELKKSLIWSLPFLPFAFYPG